MNWWQRLQQVVAKAREPEGPSRSPSEVLVPSAAPAFCSKDDNLFRVEVRGVGVSSIRLKSTRPLASGEYAVRVPVGKNFENRETTEYVEFVGVAAPSNRTPGGYETDLRYSETSNARRDRWIKLVLDSYGFSVNEEGNLEAEARGLPCRIHVLAYDQWLRGQVLSVSLKGMVARVHGDPQEPGRSLMIELGNPPADPSAQLRVYGRVIEAEKADDGMTLGVAFDEVNVDQYMHIVECVRTLASSG